MSSKIVLNKKQCSLCGSEGKPLLRFPKSVERMSAWLTCIKKQELLSDLSSTYIRNNGRLCSAHFQDWAFTSSEKKHLIRYALPVVTNADALATKNSLELSTIADHSKACARKPPNVVNNFTTPTVKTPNVVNNDFTTPTVKPPIVVNNDVTNSDSENNDFTHSDCENNDFTDSDSESNDFTKSDSEFESGMEDYYAPVQPEVTNSCFQPRVSTAEDIDNNFGYLIISILKTIPESKKKDDTRINIIENLYRCKNS